MESKSRKRQLSEEQPSGNGVKKPKVSVYASQGLADKCMLAAPCKGWVRRDSQVQLLGMVLGLSADFEAFWILFLQIEIPVTPTSQSVPSSPSIPGTPTLKIWGASTEDKQQAALLRPTE